MSNQHIARKNKDPLDFYETPPVAVHKLLQNVDFDPRLIIWEPAAGTGAIVEVLRGYHLEVCATDVKFYGFQLYHQCDFLQTTWQVPYIITNPPYNQAEAFVRHALKNATHKVAMLMRLGFLESQKRYKLFIEDRLAPTEVLVFSRRIDCRGEAKDSSQVCFAWYIWDMEEIKKRLDSPHYPPSPAIIRWILHTEEEEQSS